MPLNLSKYQPSGLKEMYVEKIYGKSAWYDIPKCYGFEKQFLLHNIFSFRLTGFLEFYGISTVVGYLMPNPFLYK